MQLLFRILLITLLPLRPAFATETIQFSNAWINEAPPAVKVLAGYVTINNPDDEPVDLISVHSPVFEKVEFHNTQITDGVASMVKQDVISIPARSEFSFSPGDMHLMLFNKLMPLKSGDTVILELTFSNGKTARVEFELRRSDSHEHEHH